MPYIYLEGYISHQIGQIVLARSSYLSNLVAKSIGFNYFRLRLAHLNSYEKDHIPLPGQ